MRLTPKGSPRACARPACWIDFEVGRRSSNEPGAAKRPADLNVSLHYATHATPISRATSAMPIVGCANWPPRCSITRRLYCSIGATEAPIYATSGYDGPTRRQRRKLLLGFGAIPAHQIQFTEVLMGRRLKTTRYRGHFVDTALSPCREFGSRTDIPAPWSARPLWCLVFAGPPSLREV